MSNSLTRKFTPSKIGLAVAAPLAAAVFSIAISSIAVIVSKKSPLEAFRTMWDYGTEPGSLMEQAFLTLELKGSCA
jgi:simple sugar transport system permease protein